MPHPHERLLSRPHDRAGVRRADDAWLTERWDDPETRVLVVAGTRVRPREGRLDWVRPQEAPDGLRVLLGERDGCAWFAVITDPDPDGSEGWYPLRGLLPDLADDTLTTAPLVFHALGLAEWLFATRYCPRCGGDLVPRSSGHQLVCRACERPQFPRMDPAVIMLITAGEPDTADERCLLGRQPIWPDGRYSTLAGFCEPGESLEDAVRREVAEETGVLVGDVTYFGSQPWPMPASLMIGFLGRAETTGIVVDDDELSDARWFTREQLRAEAEAGTLKLPRGVSISRSLIETWYGEALPGSW